METTEFQAVVATQSEAPQQLTSPVDTATYPTPTLSFGEVGETKDQQMPGYANSAAGVGEFEDTQLLERMVLVANLDWSLTDVGTLFSTDIDQFLRQYPRNAAVLSQFNYYRSDIELTLRLNTNQFYYGALMVTTFPTNFTGNRVDERSVLDPTIISASVADSVVKTWSYAFPYMWKRLEGALAPVRLFVDIVAPLRVANDMMPDTISVQIWARFKNIVLSYPTGALTSNLLNLGYEGFEKIERESQSSSDQGKVITKLAKKPYPKIVSREKSCSHPALDQVSSSGFKTLDAIENIKVGDIVADVGKLATSFLPAATSFFFDKPDRSVVQFPVISEPCIDQFLTDIPDSNTSISVYKDRYVDPGPGRMPLTKEYSVSDYSRIPGLRGPVSMFDTQGDTAIVPLIQAHPTSETYAIPLDYAWLSSSLWRGSIKICFQFFTSAFISARFILQYKNASEEPIGYPTDYTNGISKVINVKGDTADSVMIPWLSHRWWTDDAIPELKLTLESRIASTDTAADPVIYMICWVAGGDDIQFAYPTPVRVSDWNGITAVEAQSAIGDIFKQNFSPIVENVAFDLDYGYSNNEALGTITSLCKRYSPIKTEYYDSLLFSGTTLDDISNNAVTNGFRSTIFGAWRHAFLFRSGGYKWRYYAPLNDRTDRKSVV